MIAYSQLYVGNNALLHIADDGDLVVGGTLINRGVLQNTGTLSLYGDWSVNDNFNGLEGNIQFLGDREQNITLPQLIVSGMIVDKNGTVNLSGNEYIVRDLIDFRFGYIKNRPGTRFVLGTQANVNGGSNLSYFDGRVIHQGSGIKVFPVGNDGLFGPLTLVNVFGINTEIGVNFVRENQADPIPNDSILGVSHIGLWDVELLSGTYDPSRVLIEFNENDLSDFRIFNNIRHRIKSPIIAEANTPAGIFQPIGVRELTNTDSLTFGTIESRKTLSLSLRQKKYIAIALAPQVPTNGVYYIPEAFSPQASDVRNQRFRLFGERILEEGFSLVIYNRFGAEVYSTNSFMEANNLGWDGRNQRTGATEPGGVYYYLVRFQFITEEVVEKQGAFQLIR